MNRLIVAVLGLILTASAVFANGAIAERKTGALIAIERRTPLGEYAATGVSLDAMISVPFIEALFARTERARRKLSAAWREGGVETWPKLGKEEVGRRLVTAMESVKSVLSES